MKKHASERKNTMRLFRPASLILCVLLLLGSVCAIAAPAEEVETARPSVNGRLHVDGQQLVDERDDAVRLRGVSTHGILWYPDFLNEKLFNRVSDDWDCNVIRIPVYSELYCGGDREQSLELLHRGIEAAISADMYVIVDWHILEDADPNEHIDEAVEFFDTISEEYAYCPNLLFEICNEPNGETQWADILRYSEEVIPVIRENIHKAVVLVGTPEFDRNLGGALLRPLDFDNVMYVLHFYAASHGDGLMGELEAALDRGLPVFISECGLCESDGSGRIDFKSAAGWFSLLDERGLSYAVWSLSNKDESSAFFKPGFDPENDMRDSDLTAVGLWVRELIRGADPETIPTPGDTVDRSGGDEARTLINSSLRPRGFRAVALWTLFAGISAAVLLAATAAWLLYKRAGKNKRRTYDDICRTEEGERAFSLKDRPVPKICLILSAYCTLIYLCWRIVCSVPIYSGVIAVAGNILLLIVEIFGFVESLVLFQNLMGRRDYPLPAIPDDAWPEVDVFIATYNEPVELLRKTVNGCRHMRYPDASKVHIWLCDDNRRPEMRALAEELGVGYFDRPDNEGAKAGNLNHALGLTHAPYVVTFDADMIPKSDFLLKTVPYFVDAQLREQERPEEERLRLGFIQTPQSFYTPDVFQHALYSEKRAPNEQDFFYRTIEPAKTSTNSVIYGGSNTVLSRQALEDAGGFYEDSITEDFATGLLIESQGYVSLALPEPLASGQSPRTFRDHIKQRTRWARGVIVTSKKLKIWRRPELTFEQKLSYWSSVAYWYSPIKNLIYIVSPLLYAVLAIPVFRCNWLELLVFWLPMFILQDLSLRLNSRNVICSKWTGIYETSLMPHLLIPVIKESLGISLTKFTVTDKSEQIGKRQRDLRSMLPFIILAVLSIAGLIRVLACFELLQTVSILILLFWILRNLYFLVMSMFLVDGRDSDGENVKVVDAELVKVKAGERQYEGVTTLLTEHNLTVFLDDSGDLGLGEPV
ncbi:MAG: cellulase family glycosylhydrolase, partial [Oscillospiraceae bacterium]|nr:cellulase family glycosylhydrolase [Oscillospiraceae bacterium]